MPTSTIFGTSPDDPTSPQPRSPNAMAASKPIGRHPDVIALATSRATPVSFHAEPENAHGRDIENGAQDGFPVSADAATFYQRIFPGTSAVEWNDWRWQMRSRLRTLAKIEEVFKLSDDERAAMRCHDGALPTAIPPYYASLMGVTDPAEPLRRTHIPVMAEYSVAPNELEDPLGEDGDMPVPNLVHRYPDRVLFLATGFCASYCRYCTRSRIVGDAGGEYHFSSSEWDNQIEYIRQHPEIRDCLISGGDPLTLSTEKLDALLTRLRSIPHLEFIRIGSKMPVVVPQRVTPKLAAMLGRHGVWLSLHFTHPAELTAEVREACRRLADAGIPLGSQTVLLRGINDSLPIMMSLMQGLLTVRVRPYYLYLADMIAGSSHFRTTVTGALAIIDGIRGHTTGYAVPHLVIDAPGGGGKIPLQPNNIVGRDGDELLLRNYEGKVFRYPDPIANQSALAEPGQGLAPSCASSDEQRRSALLGEG